MGWGWNSGLIMGLGWIECVCVMGVLGFFDRLALVVFVSYLWRVLFSAFSSFLL